MSFDTLVSNSLLHPGARACSLAGNALATMVKRICIFIVKNKITSTLVLLGGIGYKSLPFLRKVLAYIRRYLGPYLYTLLIHMTSEIRYPVLRRNFQHADIPKLNNGNKHTHPVAAADRSAANLFIDQVATSSGFSIYSVSLSGRDIRASNAGSRWFYMAKDTALQFQNDKINKTDVLKFVDVDYYAHMSDYLAYVQPVLIYTFVPTVVASSSTDFTYTIEENMVKMDVNGGAKYEHEIWDYETDSLVVDRWWGSAVFLVEYRLTSDKMRKIIGLFPVRKIWGPWAWFLPGKRLERRRYTWDKVNVNRFQEKNDTLTEAYTSLGYAGDRSSVAIKDKPLRTALIRCDLAKNPSISDVERVFRSDEVVNPSFAASLFLDFYKTNRKLLLSQLPIITLCGQDTDEHSYQAIGPLVTEDGKPIARKISPSLVEEPGVAPKKSYNNDIACVQNRIEKIKNDVQSFPPFYKQCRDEFVRHLIPKNVMHTGVPLNEAEVEFVQNRPNQRSLAEQSKPFSFLSKFVVKSFQKAEVYGKIVAPRNISTVPVDHRLRYSAFMLSLTKHIKACSWYAFGHTPREIEESMREVAAKAKFLVPTDFSKFDGTHGVFLCELEAMILVSYFPPEYHEEVIKLYKDQFFSPAVTTEGVRYNTEFTRLSGSAETSVFNTVDNAFIAYLALRHSYNSEDAWQMLGLYGGDDGVTPNIPKEIYEKIVKKLGMSLKAEKVERGNAVPFLGRIFIDPWTTETSVCDVQRRLKTLHLTITPGDIPDSVVLYRKVDGYMVTDGKTPVISHWARAIQRIVPRLSIVLNEVQQQTLKRETVWFSSYEDNFTNTDEERVWEVIAENCGVDVAFLEKVCSALDACQTLQDLDKVPKFSFDRKIELCVDLGGHVVGKAPPTLTVRDSNKIAVMQRRWRNYQPHHHK